MTEPLDDARGELLGVLNAARVALKNRDQSPFEAAVLASLKIAIAKLESPAPVPQCEAEPGDDSQHYLALMGLTSYVVANFPRADQWIQGGRPVLKDAKEALAAPPSRLDAGSAAPVNLTDAVLNDALSEYWDLSPRSNWTDAQRVGMRKAILTALVPPPSEAGREVAENALRGEIWCLREIVRGVRIMANAGAFSAFEGEAWLKRVRNIDLNHDPVKTAAALSTDPGTVAVASANCECRFPNCDCAGSPLDPVCAISSTDRETPQ